MEELNNEKSYRIKNCSPYQFTVEVSTKNMKQYERQGMVEDVKVIQTVKF
jgi:hypothetical protein